MKLAAIDIGSNAIRFQVTNVMEYEKSIPIFKKIEYIRFPLRLGHDVFRKGEISVLKRDKFVQLMQTFKLLMDLYEVDHYMGCATSAMRESSNGREIIDQVKEDFGLEIDIIDGETEASYINTAINAFLKEGLFVHIDVGGGSTEINLYEDGKKLNSASFQVGAVRSLEKMNSAESWEIMKTWVKNNIVKKGKVTAIGTGGNIKKIYDLANHKIGKSISLKKVITTVDFIKEYSYEDKQRYLQLNPDRADVIIPAAEIYIAVMEWAKVSSIIVPDVGLKDGLMLEMYNRYYK